jgi:hypothetical protein
MMRSEAESIGSMVGTFAALAAILCALFLISCSFDAPDPLKDQPTWNTINPDRQTVDITPGSTGAALITDARGYSMLVRCARTSTLVLSVESDSEVRPSNGLILNWKWHD